MSTKRTYLKSFTVIKKLKRIQKVGKTENCMLEKKTKKNTHTQLVQYFYKTAERRKS
jgi:hypothetical protein